MILFISDKQITIFNYYRENEIYYIYLITVKFEYFMPKLESPAIKAIELTAISNRKTERANKEFLLK
jgi:hypothetical protein